MAETVRIVRMPYRFSGSLAYFICPGVVNIATPKGEACFPAPMLPRSELGRVSRAPGDLSAARNCTRDEGGPFEFGDQEPISSHRKLLRAKAVVVSVAETPGQDFGRHGRERRAQANRCRSVESGLGDVRTGG